MPATLLSAKSYDHESRIPLESRKHYVPLAVRFDRLTLKAGADECWEWAGYRDAKGYGRFRISRQEQTRAHRVAYMLAHGSIPEDCHILHSCDNAACVNPRHLSADTNAENQVQAWARDRKRRVRKLSPEDVLAIRSSDLSQAVLAPVYGVHQSEISRVRRGQRGDAILLMTQEA